MEALFRITLLPLKADQEICSTLEISHVMLYRYFKEAELPEELQKPPASFQNLHSKEA